MYPTVRRYEGIDKARAREVTRKAGLTPSLSKLAGFSGYYPIDAGEGVFTSAGLFENAERARESTRTAARRVRAQKLQSALPTRPKVTAGPVIAHEWSGAAVTHGVPALA